MSFFSMSQNENMFSSKSMLQKQDKMSFRTADPYTKPTLYQQPRTFSPMKMNRSFFPNQNNERENMKSFVNKCDGFSENHQSSFRQNLSTSSMFPNNQGFMFHQNPIKSNASFIHQNNEANSLRQKSEINVQNDQIYEDAKLKLTEYLGNEFNTFKKEIQSVDFLKKHDYEQMILNIEDGMSQKLEPYVSLVKNSSVEIENEMKNISRIIRFNNTLILNKYKKFNKIFDESLNIIEKNVNKNKDNFVFIENTIKKLTNPPDEDLEQSQKLINKQSPPQKNKKKKKK